jgi:hypothetical protein
MRPPHLQVHVLGQDRRRHLWVVGQEDDLVARDGVDEGRHQLVQLHEEGAGVVEVDDGEALDVVGLRGRGGVAWEWGI